MAEILDSGNRREFETGAVRDIQEGKGRMDLLPWAAIMEVSKHCENGALKYGEHNVDHGIPTHSLCDSAARHLAKYFEGWDDEPHLLAAAWNLLWAIQMEIHCPEMCDVPWTRKAEEPEETAGHPDPTGVLGECGLRQNCLWSILDCVGAALKMQYPHKYLTWGGGRNSMLFSIWVDDLMDRLAGEEGEA